MSAGNAGVARPNNNLDTLAPKFRQAVEKAIADCAARRPRCHSLRGVSIAGVAVAVLLSRAYGRPAALDRDERGEQSVQLARLRPRRRRHLAIARVGRARVVVRAGRRVFSRGWLPLGRRVEDEGPSALSVGPLQAESVRSRARADFDRWLARRLGSGDAL